MGAEFGMSGWGADKPGRRRIRPSFNDVQDERMGPEFRMNGRGAEFRMSGWGADKPGRRCPIRPSFNDVQDERMGPEFRMSGWGRGLG